MQNAESILGALRLLQGWLNPVQELRGLLKAKIERKKQCRLWVPASKSEFCEAWSTERLSVESCFAAAKGKARKSRHLRRFVLGPGQGRPTA